MSYTEVNEVTGTITGFKRYRSCDSRFQEISSLKATFVVPLTKDDLEDLEACKDDLSLLGLSEAKVLQVCQDVQEGNVAYYESEMPSQMSEVIEIVTTDSEFLILLDDGIPEEDDPRMIILKKD